MARVRERGRDRRRRGARAAPAGHAPHAARRRADTAGVGADGPCFGAVALAVGKIVPEVSKSSNEWAYAAIGAGYALLGVLVIVYGLIRRKELEDALSEGGYAPVNSALVTIVLIGSAVLGAAIAAVILFA